MKCVEGSEARGIETPWERSLERTFLMNGSRWEGRCRGTSGQTGSRMETGSSRRPVRVEVGVHRLVSTVDSDLGPVNVNPKTGRPKVLSDG